MTRSGPIGGDAARAAKRQARALRDRLLPDDGVAYRRSLDAQHELGERYGASWPGLARFERSVYSQNGEDGVLLEITHRLGITRGTFLEVGAEADQANCLLLAHAGGWGGLFVDASTERAARLAALFAPHPRVDAEHARVTPETIDRWALAAERGSGTPVDLLSIDVDGADYWLWKGLTAASPAVVVIEYNSSLPAGSQLVQPPDAPAWDRSSDFGASIGALCALAASKGYALVHCETAGINAFFVRSDLAEAFDPPEEVALRGPNYGSQGVGHPPSAAPRFEYLDLRPGPESA